MKKVLLWEEILASLNVIGTRLQQLELTDEGRYLENRKRQFLVELFMLIQHIGKSTEKSSMKYEAWLNKGNNRKESSEKLGMTVDGLRATIWYFNSRLENIVGADTVTIIVNCKTQHELSEIENRLRSRFSSLNKGYFR